MTISKTILLAIGRAIVWLCFILLTTVFVHNADWFSALASATGSAFALVQVGKFPRFTLKVKIVLLLFFLVVAVLLQPKPKLSAQRVGLVFLSVQHA